LIIKIIILNIIAIANSKNILWKVSLRQSPAGTRTPSPKTRSAVVRGDSTTKRRGPRHSRKMEKMSQWLNLKKRSPSISPDRIIPQHKKRKRRLLSKLRRDKQDSSSLIGRQTNPASLEHQRLGLMISNSRSNLLKT
jgi:hypothetical protein